MNEFLTRKKKIRFQSLGNVSLAFLVLILILNACRNSGKDQNQPMNVLTSDEKAAGWQLLFDGKNLDQWRGYQSDSLPAHWKVMDSTITIDVALSDEPSDIITRKIYTDFDLKWEWKIAGEGNSGLFYNVTEDYPAMYASGPEYQMIDDIGFPSYLEPWQTTAANYAMHPAKDPKVKSAGKWNSSRIKVSDSIVEHWLNGGKVVEYTLWNQKWDSLKNAGKWKEFSGYGVAQAGHIGIQNHGSRVWIKNIKIKELN